jgi:RNA polymerase sigma factor (sigma-70 family)
VFTVYLVDDDEGVLRALGRRLRARGYAVEASASAGEFLARNDPERPGCALLDLALPETDGLALQERLAAGGAGRPVIFLTGTADVPSSVQAMKAGAVDFLTKPVDDAALLAAVARAERLDAEARLVRAERAELRARLDRLTPREREVLDLVLAGLLNKQIAHALGTVEQTVKVHRRRAMEKLGAKSLLGLTRTMDRLGIGPRAGTGD